MTIFAAIILNYNTTKNNSIMKKTMLWFTKAACLAMMAVCLQSASCESEEDVDTGLPHYNKFVDLSITSCERVGNVLMMDFTLKNKQNYDLTVRLRKQVATDDTGKEYPTGAAGVMAYPVTSIAIVGNKYEESATVRLASKDQVEGHLKVVAFSPDNTAKRVSVVIKVEIDNEKLSDKLFEQKDIRVVDNRLLSGGIQSNDFKLDYKVTSCKVEDGDLYVKFDIKNNTGVRLTGYSIGGGNSSITSTDNRGNKYINCGIKFSEEERWAMFSNATSDLAPGATINCTLRLGKINTNASDVSSRLEVSSDNYIFNDRWVYLLSVPIEK